MLPSAANDCDIPLILPKYFFSTELFIIILIKIIDIDPIEALIIKNILDIINNDILFMLFILDSNDIENIDIGNKNCAIKNNL